MAQDATLEDFIRFADEAGGAFASDGTIQPDMEFEDQTDETEEDNDFQDDDTSYDDQDENDDYQDDESYEDEEEDDEEEEEQQYESDDNDDDSTEFNQEAIHGLFTQLKEEGLIQVKDDFEFDGSTSGLDEALNQTFEHLSQSAQETLINSLPAEVGMLVNYSLQTGGNLQDYLKNQESNIDFEKLDLEDEGIQEEVLKQFFKQTTKYNDDRISRMVNRAKKSGELEEEARDAYRELLNMREEQKTSLQEQIETQKAQRLETERQQRENFENLIKSNSEIAKPRKSRLRNFIINKSRKRGEAQYSTELSRTLTKLAQNPEHVIQLGDLLLDYSPEKGINLERLQDKKSSKKTKEVLSRLDKILDPKTNTRTGSSSYDRKKRNSFNWDVWAKQAANGSIKVR